MTKNAPGRRRTAVALLILGGLLLLLASPAVWLRATALNTDRWTETVTPLPSSEPVADALAEYTVSEVIGEESLLQLSGLLPDQFDKLPGTARARLNGLAEGIASEAIESRAFARVWSTANRGAHEAALAALDGDGHPALTADGAVVLDLSPIITTLRADIVAAGVELPEGEGGDGRIEVLTVDQRSGLVRAVGLLRGLAFVLPVLALLLFVAAVAIAPNRTRALAWVGVVTVLAALAAIVLLRVGRTAAQEAIADGDAAAIGAVWDVLSRSLTIQSLVLVGVGLAIAAGGWALGSSPSAMRLRREGSGTPAPPTDNLPALRVGGLFAALLGVMLWPDPGLGILLGALALAAAWWVVAGLLLGSSART